MTKELIKMILELPKEDYKELQRILINKHNLPKPEWYIIELAKKEVFDDIDKIDEYYATKRNGDLEIEHEDWIKLRKRHLSPSNEGAGN